ncbi:MAG TPA: tetratricopeptide repeat protein [Terriglobia bacterium]|nr:tetratricopeptide repeat protein [Terriglobia bacterium]
MLAALLWEQHALQPRAAGLAAIAREADEAQSSPGSPQELFAKAAGLIKTGKYSAAIPLLQRAAALAPNQASIHHYLGYALWKLNRWVPAKAEFEKARQLDPRNPYTCYFLARIAQSLGHPDRSIALYEMILKMGPAIYDTHQRLGQAYLNQGELRKARAQIEAALKQEPWEGSLYYQLGRIDQREHHAALAREEFAAAGRLKNVDQASIRRLLALFQAVEDHQTDRVQELRAQLLENASKDPEILDSVGVLLGKGGLYSSALEPLQLSAKLAPNSFEANFNLGLTLLKLNRAQEAETWLNKALALEPDSVEVNKLLAILYVGQNRNAEAIERLRVANQGSPNDPKVLALLGQQYLAGHYVKQAIPCLAQAIKLNANDPSLRYLLIEAYEEQHDYPSAVSAAQDAVGHFPSDPRAIYELGQQLANLGDYKRARPYAEKAIAMQPSFAEAQDLMGDIEAKDGQYEAALESFKRAKSLDPKNVAALRGVAENLIRLRRFPEALAELKQAVAVDPNDSDLYFNLMRVYVRLGQRQEAAQAEAAFQKLHAREVAERNAQAPRSFTPPAAGREEN